MLLGIVQSNDLCDYLYIKFVRSKRDDLSYAPIREDAVV